MDFFLTFTENPGRRERVKIKPDNGVTHHQVHYLRDKPVHMWHMFAKLIERLHVNTAHASKLKVPAFRSYERLVSSVRFLRPFKAPHPRHTCCCAQHEGAKLMLAAYGRIMKETQVASCDCTCSKRRPDRATTCQAQGVAKSGPTSPGFRQAATQSH